jgi:hypothetical protein
MRQNRSKLPVKDLTTQEHLQIAKQNLEFGDWLQSSGRNDPTTVGWAVTALFYAALHEIRAYLLAHHQVKIGDHQELRRFEVDYPELKRTSQDYHQLKIDSELARYNTGTFSWQDYVELRTNVERIIRCWRHKTEAAINRSEVAGQS